MTNLRFDIVGMHCASCTERVERALKSVPGVVRASANLATQQAVVQVEAAGAHPNVLIDAVRRSGYDAKDAEQDARRQRRGIWSR